MPATTETSTIAIIAPPAKVWRALTEPTLVKQWQYGSELQTDWKIGSEIRFRNEWNGTVFEQWGTVLDIEPDTLIKYSLFFPRPGLEDIPENYFNMGYQLEATDNGTQLTITKQDNRPALESTPTNQDEEESPILTALKNLAEGL